MDEAITRLGQVVSKLQNNIEKVIVGKRDGFITGDKRVAAKAAAMRDRVIFTGEVSNDDGVFRQYFAHADALILPSLYEGFGLPPLEAMACGCPVIVSNLGSLPEVCGDAALYCDPHSPQDIAAKIKLLTQNDELRRQLSERGVENARQFTWERCAEHTVGVLESM